MLVERGGDPTESSEKNVVGFKQVDNAKTMNTRLTRVFFDHYIRGLTPTGNGDAPTGNNVHKLREALEEDGMLDDGLIMAQVTAGR